MIGGGRLGGGPFHHEEHEDREGAERRTSNAEHRREASGDGVRDIQHHESRITQPQGSVSFPVARRSPTKTAACADTVEKREAAMGSGK